MSTPPKLLLVAGARPNFMKIAPILRELEADWAGRLTPVLVHTGQHYDAAMSQAFFDELGIREPDHHLGVGSASHAEQTARVMMALEGVCIDESPALVVVVGDVNSTMAGALVAAKLNIPAAHVEAGLRSRDRTMPEEINRLVTDAVCEVLLCSEPAGAENLRAEGRPERCIHLVGNVMVDTLFHELARLNADPPELKRPEGPYAVMTLHRPANVDSRQKLAELLGAVRQMSRELPVCFPVHPRTRARMDDWGLASGEPGQDLRLMPPLPYREFLALWRQAALVLTDSGGIQEETTALSVPCFTLRDNTERPITVQEGSNTLVGTSGAGLLAAFEGFRTRGPKQGRPPALWDGRAAARIAPILARAAGA